MAQSELEASARGRSKRMQHSWQVTRPWDSEQKVAARILVNHPIKTQSRLCPPCGGPRSETAETHEHLSARRDLWS